MGKRYATILALVATSLGLFLCLSFDQRDSQLKIISVSKANSTENAPLKDVGFEENPKCENMKGEINKYACWVEQAAEGIKLAQGNELDESTLSAFKAIETLGLVSNIASSARYAYLMRQPGFKPPETTNPDKLLTKGYGICGNHQQLFIEILTKAGVEARPVDFYYSDKLGRRQNHAAAEAKIGKRWAYFDVTWETFWVRRTNDPSTMLSLEEVVQGRGKRVTGNNSWFFENTYKNVQLEMRDPFSYLKAKDLQVLRNKGGNLHLESINGEVDFTDRPNYLGKTQANDPMSVIIKGRFNPFDAALDISAVGGTCEASRLLVGKDRYPVIAGRTQIRVSPNSVLAVEGKDEICYVVISGLKMIGK